MVYYCQPQDVMAFLNLDPSLLPYVQSSIERYIALAEAEIEAISYTCYAGKPCVSELEVHTLGRWMVGWLYGPGIPIHVAHRPIRKVLRFELWTGEWLNLLQYPEQRGGVWWCDYSNGVCFIRWPYAYYGGREVRIQYEYGYDTLPDYIKQAAILIAAKQFITLERNRLAMMEGTATVNFDAMSDLIDRELSLLLDRIRGIGIGYGMY